VPALPSWLTDPLWDQFAALLPARETYVSTHPWGCHRRRIADRIVFDTLLQVLRFGCSYQGIADSTCSATTIRARRDEWIRLGIFAQLKQIALDAYDRIVELLLDDIAVDGCITKAPGGGEVAGPSPVDRRKQGMKRSLLVDGGGIPPTSATGTPTGRSTPTTPSSTASAQARATAWMTWWRSFPAISSNGTWNRPGRCRIRSGPQPPKSFIAGRRGSCGAQPGAPVAANATQAACIRAASPAGAAAGPRRPVSPCSHGS
jgi:transposase